MTAQQGAVSITDKHGFKQLDLVEAINQRALGIERALEPDSLYRKSLEAAIDYLAWTGEEFDSDSIRNMCGDPPRGVSTNLVGAIVNAAARSGRIRCVGYGISARVKGHGNLVRKWRHAGHSDSEV
jgi:hypothetical protein